MRAMRWALLGASLGITGAVWAADGTSGGTAPSPDPAGTNQSSSGVDPDRPDTPTDSRFGGSTMQNGTGSDSTTGSGQRFEGGSNSGVGTTPDSGGGEDESELGGSAPETTGGGTAPGATTPAPAPR